MEEKSGEEEPTTGIEEPHMADHPLSKGVRSCTRESDEDAAWAFADRTFNRLGEPVIEFTDWPACATTRVSQGVVSLFGYSAAELLAANFLLLQHSSHSSLETAYAAYKNHDQLRVLKDKLRARQPAGVGLLLFNKLGQVFFVAVQTFPEPRAGHSAVFVPLMLRQLKQEIQQHTYQTLSQCCGMKIVVIKSFI